MDCEAITVASFVGSGLSALTTDIGLTTGAAELCSSATDMDTVDAIIAMQAAEAHIVPVAIAQNVWLNCDPTGCNWSGITLGIIKVIVTYNNVSKQ